MDAKSHLRGEVESFGTIYAYLFSFYRDLLPTFRLCVHVFVSLWRLALLYTHRSLFGFCMFLFSFLSSSALHFTAHMDKQSAPLHLFFSNDMDTSSIARLPCSLLCLMELSPWNFLNSSLHLVPTRSPASMPALDAHPPFLII